jgi:hypothetical protein
MPSTSAFRALILSASLAMGAPALAFAAPANTGNAAEASDFQIASSIPTTRGSVPVAGNTGRGAQAAGNAPATETPLSQYQIGDNSADRVGNGASASDSFGASARG